MGDDETYRIINTHGTEVTRSRSTYGCIVTTILSDSRKCRYGGHLERFLALLRFTLRPFPNQPGAVITEFIFCCSLSSCSTKFSVRVSGDLAMGSIRSAEPEWRPFDIPVKWWDELPLAEVTEPDESPRALVDDFTECLLS